MRETAMNDLFKPPGVAEFAQEGLLRMGLGNPMARGAFAATAVYLALQATKPLALFDEDGAAREWRVTSSEPTATIVPPWLIAGLIGFWAATFI